MMNRIKKSILAVSAFAVVFGQTVVSFGAEDQGTVNENPKIAWICAELGAEVWSDFEAGVLDMAEELGIDAPVAYNANNDANEQLKAAQDCIAMEYDAVGLFANDSLSCTETLKLLNEAEIPVVLIHISPDDDTVPYGAFISSEQINGAYASAKLAVDKYVEEGYTGTVAHVTISLARDNGVLRKQGLEKALDEAGLEIAHEKEAEYYTIEEAYNYVSDMLTADDEISLIYANFDQALQGAQKAVADAGKEGEIIVAGMDSTSATIDLIKEGSILCTSAQQMYNQGRQMTQAAYDLVQNGGESLGDITSQFLLVTQDSSEEDIAEVKSLCFRQE